MSKAFQKIRDFYARNRKRGAIVLAIIVAVELIAAAAVVVAGRHFLEARSAPEKSESGGTPALGFQASRSSPSIAVF